jgi:ribose 5-phosphate isomerase A
VPDSPDGGLIADYRGPVDDPAELGAWFASIPGVVEHGLFPAKLVSDVVIGRGESAERLELERG